ncbi:Transposon Ty3-G Gag-Pol polyprotein [Dictyocoela muelleri]|nr:Transposon Ty3-G Gag-Pol polyprotein [Dictyocoela muelleri]
MKSGYYQIALKPDSKKYTALWIENTKYEWNRMPFGLTNAPKTFQRAMDKLFGDLSFVKVYLDDIVVHSCSEEEHHHHLEIVMNIINENFLKINLEKSEFYKEEIYFLGHLISCKGIRPDCRTLESFKIGKPKTKKHIQRILGFLNYFRCFIPNFSAKTTFLSELIKKEEKIKWKDEYNDKIDEIGI